MVSMKRDIQRFEVSLKAFIVRDGRVLLVRESDTGWWELPGGRINVGEEWLPHADILAREIAEELGADVRLDVSSQAVTWVRYRTMDDMHLLIVARPASLIAGEPRLSDEHDDMVWIGPDGWQQLEFPPQSGYREALSRLWALAG